jgi:hypothetical protein
VGGGGGVGGAIAERRVCEWCGITAKSLWGESLFVTSSVLSRLFGGYHGVNDRGGGAETQLNRVWELCKILVAGSSVCRPQ